MEHLLKDLSALELVKMGRAENVPEFLLSGYRSFINRRSEITTEEGDITDEEGDKLGSKTVIILWRIRYHAEAPGHEDPVELFIEEELTAKFVGEVSEIKARGNASRHLEDVRLEERLKKRAEEKTKRQEEGERLVVEKAAARDGRVEGAVEASEAGDLKAKNQVLRQELEACTRELRRANELNAFSCSGKGSSCLRKRTIKRDRKDEGREEEARVQLEMAEKLAEEERATRLLEEEEKRGLEAGLEEEREKEEAVKIREELEELRAWKRARMLEETTIDEILQDADDED